MERELEKKGYDLILADPPWHYNSRKAGGEVKNKTKFGGGAEKWYPLMKDKEILGMAPLIQRISNTPASLLLWATMPRLDFALEVMAAWGFKYKTTAFTWVKMTNNMERPRYGPGYYTASNAEIVLLGTKGKPMRPETAMVPSVILSPRQEHSRKPEEVHQRIELMYPEARKVELFARRADRPGWDYIGNELPNNVVSNVGANE